MEAKNVIQRLCELQSLVSGKLGFDEPADCFCGNGGLWGQNGYDGTEENGYRNSGRSLEFIEQAVKEKLAAPPSSSTGEPKANAVFNRREAEDKESIAELKEILSSSPTATAEEVLKRLRSEDWDSKDIVPTSNSLILKAMHEYTSLKEQEARRQAIDECIQWYVKNSPSPDPAKIDELEKLKK